MTLSFPPLLRGKQVAQAAKAGATAEAQRGCDPGLVVYALGPDTVEAALVLAPDVPLGEAMAMFPLCGIGFQNALGALSPPETAVFLTWEGGIVINGAACGRISAISSTTDPEAMVDWLVVGFEVPLLPDLDEMGEAPERTALHAEGCGDIAPGTLVEAWARHTLHWIHRWETEGAAGLHEAWRGLATGIGDSVDVRGEQGIFVGIDQAFGLLLKDGAQTRLIPLTTLLEAA